VIASACGGWTPESVTDSRSQWAVPWRKMGSRVKQGGNSYYYLADGLGSTMAVVNASLRLVEDGWAARVRRELWSTVYSSARL
jgi:hypothetical protein